MNSISIFICTECRHSVSKVHNSKRKFVKKYYKSIIIVVIVKIYSKHKPLELASKAVVTTTIRLRSDCNSTALRPFDDLRYDLPPFISETVRYRLLPVTNRKSQVADRSRRYRLPMTLSDLEKWNARGQIFLLISVTLAT